PAAVQSGGIGFALVNMGPDQFGQGSVASGLYNLRGADAINHFGVPQDTQGMVGHDLLQGSFLAGEANPQLLIVGSAGWNSLALHVWKVLPQEFVPYARVAALDYPGERQPEDFTYKAFAVSPHLSGDAYADLVSVDANGNVWEWVNRLN